jgi:hypothetical protein
MNIPFSLEYATTAAWWELAVSLLDNLLILESIPGLV